MLLIGFLHVVHPDTTTPFPPCATDGGSSKNTTNRVGEFLFEFKRAKRISAQSDILTMCRGREGWVAERTPT
jgi:hypothetical protein